MNYDTVKADREALWAFVRRGGRVLATGRWGGELLVAGAVNAARRPFGSLCYTQGTGSDRIAGVGAVAMDASVAWRPRDATPGVHTETLASCGADAMVVRLRSGAGEAIWWAAPTPLTNSGLHDDPSLRLLLLSLDSTMADAPRTVLFDERVHRDTVETGDLLRGLPLRWLGLQAAFVALLLLFSFSRRMGPVRAPWSAGRTSPLEFAWSIGALYSKAGATEAPVGTALRRLSQRLTQEFAVAPAMLPGGGEAGLATFLSRRLGGEDWYALERDMLQATAFAEQGKRSQRQAWRLVRTLDAHTALLDRRVNGRAKENHGKREACDRSSTADGAGGDWGSRSVVRARHSPVAAGDCGAA